MKLLKEKRRSEIIKSAIKLFAEKGFHTTSVQDIVDDTGISKGAFYIYFTSKEALHIAIFQYYFEQMNARFTEIDQEKLDPREKMKKQLAIPFVEFSERKEFIKMYLREQSFSINKELREFMEKTQYETLIWHDRSLKAIYGKSIAPYIGDIILMIEGMRNSYLGAMLFHDLHIDANLLPNFLMNRIDDIVDAFERGEKSIIQTSDKLFSFPTSSFGIINEKEKAASLLADMQEQLEGMNVDDELRTGMNSVLAYLTEELEKPDLEKYIFQGILANLKKVKEFDVYRKKIASLLNIQLL